MSNNKLVWLTLWSIAMGFMESAVVIYLREIYYPAGFQFPLVPIDSDIGLVEFFREAATMIMLAGIGIMTGRTASTKFAAFIYSFAVWDIVYYIFLKVFLNWPESLFTWDILFLIPVPWVGPVISPLLVSTAMIVLASFIFYFHARGLNTRITGMEWKILIAGSIIVIVSWMWDYIRYIRSAGELANVWTLSDKDAILKQVSEYIPVDFNWLLFSAGMLLIIYGILRYVFRLKKQLPAFVN